MNKSLLLSTVALIITALQAMAQNVGIGTATPTQKLDVNGRIRLRHNPGLTAGIWLDGPLYASIGFIGTINDTYVGIYGGVSGWKFAMNVENGYVGLGTTTPTAALDVNGDFRLRGNSPSNGAKLVSTDANGNTAWQRTSAFRAEGLVDYTDINLQSNVSTKINFHYTPVYNIGITYNGQTSTFTAPVKGVYFFSTHIETFLTTNSTQGSMTLELMRTRNNVSVVLSREYLGTYISGSIDAFKPEITHAIASDFLLEAGDQVWVRATSFLVHKCLGADDYASFSGHLVSQVY